MDRDRRVDALGLLTLAIILCAGLALGAPVSEPPQALPVLDPNTLSATDRVLLGGAIPANCGEPGAWEALPGIGPALGGRLARAAEAGRLLSPADLLQVHGIGTKMAATLARRVDFRPANEREVAR